MNKSKTIVRLILTTSIFFVPNSWALELDLGINATNSTFSVADYTNGQKGDEIARLQSKQKLTPLIRLSTKPKYFDDSSFGYEYFLGYSQGENNTVTSKNLLTNPTTIKTSILYGGGTVFYTLGEKKNTAGEFMIGLGLGAGYLNAKGTISAAITTTDATENVDINEPGLAVELYFRYLNNGWFFDAGGRGVRASSSNRVYQANEILISFGKVFDLEDLPNLFESNLKQSEDTVPIKKNR